MKNITITTNSATNSEIYSVPCGSGFLCSTESDFENSWLADEILDDEPNESVATEEELEEAWVSAKMEAAGCTIEYFKMDGEEGVELPDGDMWSGETRLARVTNKNGVEYYFAEDQGGCPVELDDADFLLEAGMITDEYPSPELVSAATGRVI